MKRFLLGTFATLAMLFFAFWMEGGNLGRLLLPSPFIITFGMPLFAVLAVWELRAWGQAWKDAFTAQADPAVRARSERLWAFYESMCYIAIAVGFIAGLVIIFANLRVDRSLESLGASFSVGFTAPFLGICFAIVARILRHRIGALAAG